MYCFRKTYLKNICAGAYFADYLKDSLRSRATKEKLYCNCILMVSLITKCFISNMSRGGHFAMIILLEPRALARAYDKNSRNVGAVIRFYVCLNKSFEMTLDFVLIVKFTEFWIRCLSTRITRQLNITRLHNESWNFDWT